MKRLFVALHFQPHPALLQLLSDLQLKLSHERISWMNPSNIHLTLKFLGETDEKRLPEITHAINNSIFNQLPINILFDKTGIFGSRYDPRVIWLGSKDNNSSLQLLASRLLDNFDSIGFLRDRQNFVPHLTLGRIKGLNDKRYFQDVISNIPDKVYQETVATEIILFESILRKEGPLYLVQSRHPFKSDGIASETA